jgi:hypothetical protein
MFTLSVWQNGNFCAEVSGDDFERVHKEATHYAMVYGQDGPTEIRGIPLERLEWLKESLSGKAPTP